MLKFILEVIIDNDGVHPVVSVKSFVLPLKKGFYPVLVEYFQKDDNNSFQLLYFNPETMKNPKSIPFKYEISYNTLFYETQLLGHFQR